MHDILVSCRMRTPKNVDRNVPLLKGANMEISMTSLQPGEKKFKRQVVDFKEVWGIITAITAFEIQAFDRSSEYFARRWMFYIQPKR